LSVPRLKISLILMSKKNISIDLVARLLLNSMSLLSYVVPSLSNLLKKYVT